VQGSEPGQQLQLTVLVDHPQLGRYFDAALVLKRCPDHQQGPNERSGWGNLLR
jgi:hypothetical protein